MMPEPLLYLKAMGAAAVVSAMFMLAMVSVRRTANTTWWNQACVPGIGLGLAVGYSVLSFQPAWPPVNGLDRLLTIVIPAVLGIEFIAGFQHTPRWVAWFMRMILVAIIPRILLHGSVYLSGSDDGWTLWQSGTILAVCSVLLAGLWSLLSLLSVRSPGVSLSLALCLAIQCTGVTVMMAGYIKGGAAALPLVATILATTAGVWLISRRSTTTASFHVPAIMGLGVVGLFGLLFIGRFFGRLSTGAALTMLLAPLLCWATETLPVPHQKPWLVGTLRLLLVAIPLVVLLVLAKIAFDRDMSPLLSVSD